MIPDRIWGLKITEACNIHDWMYRLDKEGGKKQADEWFKENMDYLINHGIQWWWLVKLRKRRAELYYGVVSSEFGKKYYDKIRNIVL